MTDAAAPGCEGMPKLLPMELAAHLDRSMHVVCVMVMRPASMHSAPAAPVCWEKMACAAMRVRLTLVGFAMATIRAATLPQLYRCPHRATILLMLLQLTLPSSVPSGQRW